MLCALFSTTDTLELITSSAADLEVLATYTDLVKSSGAWSKTDRQATKITTATTTTILAAPATTEVRGINSLFVRNKHASSSNNITMQYAATGPTLYEVYKTTLLAEETLEYIEGIGFFKLGAVSTGFGDVLERRLDATQTGTNGTAAQNWFPTLGAVAVEAATTYDFRGVLNLTRAAGTVSHTTSLLFAGTATLTSILWRASCNTGDTLANAAGNHAAGRSAGAVVVKAASTSGTEECSLMVEGSVKINAAGTFIPQFSYSAAPGGAPTIQIGSFFMLTKKGTSFNARGTWT